MMITVRKAGIAAPGSDHSTSVSAPIISAPTKIRAGAVAAAGIACTKGAKNRVQRNKNPTTTLVKPVRPPTATPEALSM